MQRKIHHEWCMEMRHGQMAYTQQAQRHACKKKKKQAKITSLWRPQSHLIIYHIQTLNGAALKTEQETGSFTEANSMAFILEQHLNTLRLNWHFVFCQMTVREAAEISIEIIHGDTDSNSLRVFLCLTSYLHLIQHLTLVLRRPQPLMWWNQSHIF